MTQKSFFLRSYLRNGDAFVAESPLPMIPDMELRRLLGLEMNDDLLACYPITTMMEEFLARQGWVLDKMRLEYFVEP